MAKKGKPEKDTVQMSWVPVVDGEPVTGADSPPEPPKQEAQREYKKLTLHVSYAKAASVQEVLAGLNELHEEIALTSKIGGLIPNVPMEDRGALMTILLRHLETIQRRSTILYEGFGIVKGTHEPMEGMEDNPLAKAR